MSKNNNINEKPVKSGKLGIILLSAGIALVLTFCIVFNVLAMTKFDNVLTQFLGKGESSTRGETYGADVNYVKSDFKDAAELYAYEEKLCAEIAQDGATLLKNDGLLPLKEGRQLDLYSHSSVNLVSGGSGSGSGSFELTADLKTGLEHAGFKVNDKLWDFYKSGAGSGYGRGAGVINYGRGFDWALNECPLDVIKADAGVMGSIDRANVAMFVISRTGGEGGDEPRDMKEFGGESGEHYLELDAREKEIIKFLGESYDNVIILVNSNNAFELGWVNDTANYKNINAVINFPGAGRTGTYGLGYMLRGIDADGKEISPSGHLVDTLAADNFSSPAMQNFGDAAFTDGQGRMIMYWGDKVMYGNGQYGNGPDNVNEDAGRCPFYFVTYNEGIYVGYKYYETRYEDTVLASANVGDYDYASTVVYPFGYGASYTDFTWSGFTATQPDDSGDMTVSVEVTNNGPRAGKDVVQLYWQAPYTPADKANHIEKAAVNLGGFAKTGLLAPGESEKVVLTVNVEDFASYDDSGEGAYVLEEGDYYVTLAGDAHTAVNNILKARAEDGVKIDTTKIVETSSLVGVDSLRASSAEFVARPQVAASADDSVKALFADANVIDRADYLSRQNWARMDNDGLRYAKEQVAQYCPGEGKNPYGNTHVASCAEINGKQFRAVMPDGLLEKLTSRSSLIPDDKKADNTTAPVLGRDHGIDLVDLRGKAYDDPLWEKLLEQVTVKELSQMVAQSGYCSPEMKSINKPLVSDLDGPAGLNQVVGHGSAPISKDLVAMTWPTEYMLASTWDDGLAFEMGKAVGEDGLYAGVTGWYGPAMNIHRTPFSGRNFEYYSEDAYLSGILGKNAVRGAASKGMYGFIKHFAVNDQETHRDQNGLVTFLNEQSLREIYLRPFQMTIENNDVEIRYNEAVKEDGGNITGYVSKTALMPACTAVMSSFNRIGATWAGGNYKLLTQVLREEFGFNGFVLTDYDTGNYMISNTKQMLEAGGDAKLNTIGTWNGLTSGAEKNENMHYAVAAAHNVLYAVVNSAAMNGYVHGVTFVPGFAYYKAILIALDIAGGIGIAVMAFFIFRKARRLIAAKRK